MSTPDSAHFIIFSDGGARGNPGPAAAAALVFNPDHTLVLKSGTYLGTATNNEAEYHGVIHALESLLHLYSKTVPSHTHLEFNLDSQLVARQLSGQYKLKNERLKPLAARVHQLLQKLNAHATFSSISRDQNAQADTLVNQVLDAQPGAKPRF